MLRAISYLDSLLECRTATYICHSTITVFTDHHAALTVARVSYLLVDVGNAFDESETRRRIIVRVRRQDIPYEQPGWYYLLRKALYGGGDSASTFVNDHFELLRAIERIGQSMADVCVFIIHCISARGAEASTFIFETYLLNSNTKC